jgi:hypothetical protein
MNGGNAGTGAAVTAMVCGPAVKLRYAKEFARPSVVLCSVVPSAARSCCR